MPKAYRSRILFCSALSIILWPTLGLADAPGEVCNAVFSRGISDSYSVFSESEQFSIYQDRMCKANFDSYQSMNSTSGSLGVDVPLADVLIGLQGDYNQKSSEFKQKYSKFCQSTYASYENRAIFSSNTTKINSALVAGWNACMATVYDAYIRQNGIMVDVNPYGHGESFVATVRVRSAETSPVKITAIHPDRKVACYRGGVQVIPGKTQIASKDFSMTCNKDPSLEVPFVVEVSTPYTSKAVKVPSNRTMLDDIASQVASLSGRLSAVDQRVSALDQRAPRLECKMASTGAVGPARNVSSEVRIPESDRGKGYFVTGGGCAGFEVPAPHNPIVTDSKRTTDGLGWFCQSRDQKDTDTPHHMNVYAIYCKVHPQ